MPCSSLYSPLNILCNPTYLCSVQSSRPLKNTNHSRTGRSNNCVIGTHFSSFSGKDPSFTTHVWSSYHFSGSGQNSDAKNTKSQSMTPSLDPGTLGPLLQSCYSVRNVERIHSLIMKCLGEHPIFVYNNLINAYIRFGRLLDARKVFDQMPNRNVVTWTAIIKGYSKSDLDDEALLLYINFVETGGHANGKTFVCILNLCTKRFDLELGKQIHACVLKGNHGNLFVNTTIVSFYARCGDLPAAFCAFDQMLERDVVCWTTMIAACSQEGQEEEALSMFTQMMSEQFSPNEFTVCSVLKACGEQKALHFGRQLHGLAVKKLLEDVFIGTSLVDMYAECGEILNSRKVFDRMPNRNTVTWTSIIAAYARNGLGLEAISLFRIMRRRYVFSNNLTVVSILRACGLVGALLIGKEVHAQSVKNSIQSNIHIGSTLIWFYCRCGQRPTASNVLQLMPCRDVVSWTAMISGCARLGHESEALKLLKEMLDEGVEPNQFTYSSALRACANREMILQGKLIHSSLNKSLGLSNVFVGSALVDMYAKCGYVSEAIQVFDSMPERNLVSWKAMIVGYARNGLCQEALKLMYRMQAEGIEVDDYTLSTVLTACGDFDWTMGLLSDNFLHSS